MLSSGTIGPITGINSCCQHQPQLSSLVQSHNHSFLHCNTFLSPCSSRRNFTSQFYSASNPSNERPSPSRLLVLVTRTSREVSATFIILNESCCQPTDPRVPDQTTTMSRKPTGSTVVKPSPGGTNLLPSDMCPVCKRVRYLNTNMEFLINPECYHAMCSNCVENIFKSGPAQCPYATCTKTLRQRGFRSAFFGDLTVEREVDIRKRVAAAYNNVEDDFETLRDYNNYLQDVEDLTFDLISGGDDERAKAEEKLIHREQQFKQQIEANKLRGRKEELSRQKRDAAEAEAAKLRRADELREEERARAEKATINAEVMEALARGEQGSAAEIQARIVAQKQARLAAISSTHFPSFLDSANDGLAIRGLKKKASPDDEEDLSKPYDPFAGLGPALQPSRYELHAKYENPWLEDARLRDDHRVPGYEIGEYVARAMFDAFAGLGVSIADEKADTARGPGTITATSAAVSRAGSRMEVDDVF
ncbi:CDK-activating kinase assembly factor MAT1-domain-containing protein [Xylariaceae sp. FL0255]|nr:CDK-activating kinase assembly factor MAT1-domain-containing protein [Xylariaceae sp. FL0255]